MMQSRIFYPFKVGMAQGSWLKARGPYLRALRLDKLNFLDLSRQLVKFIDLTTLEGTDSPRSIQVLCREALRPLHLKGSDLSCAAVCVYPYWIPYAKRSLEGSRVKIACVAGGFPSGQTFLKTKIDEIRRAIHAGADEVDVPLNRGLLLSNQVKEMKRELTMIRRASREVVLKLILETSEIPSLEQLRFVSRIAMQEGVDFIKTSTGKGAAGATLPETMVMMEAVRDWFLQTGIRVGVKVAGGIRKVDTALNYYVMAQQVLGENWLHPTYFRMGASSLLNNIKKILL
jgi:deoxyribose-phosphate aldolase